MHRRFPGASFLVAALLVGACAGGAAPTISPATPAPPSAAPTSAVPTASATDSPTDSPTGAPIGTALVELASSEFGDIVVDSAGRTLYGFTPDEPTGEPTCYGDCAANWPALTADGEIVVGEGLDPSSFTLVSRTDDAGDQVKFGIHPLYYFAGDSAPGDVNGQGVGDIWFVVGADGELITD